MCVLPAATASVQAPPPISARVRGTSRRLMLSALNLPAPQFYFSRAAFRGRNAGPCRLQALQNARDLGGKGQRLDALGLLDLQEHEFNAGCRFAEARAADVKLGVDTLRVGGNDAHGDLDKVLLLHLVKIVHVQLERVESAMRALPVGRINPHMLREG